jgi:hypothetical protein
MSLPLIELSVVSTLSRLAWKLFMANALAYSIAPPVTKKKKVLYRWILNAKYVDSSLAPNPFWSDTPKINMTRFEYKNFFEVNLLALFCKLDRFTIANYSSRRTKTVWLTKRARIFTPKFLHNIGSRCQSYKLYFRRWHSRITSFSDCPRLHFPT